MKISPDWKLHESFFNAVPSSPVKTQRDIKAKTWFNLLQPKPDHA